MDAQVMLALAIASPIIILPVLFVWYMNVGGVFSAFKKAVNKRAQQDSLSQRVETEGK